MRRRPPLSSRLVVGLPPLAASVWCAYVALVSHPSSGLALIAAWCLVVSLWLLATGGP